jgi:hypothetical protein
VLLILIKIVSKLVLTKLKNPVECAPR